MPYTIQALTVGPVETNCYLIFPTGSELAVVIDPGDEAEAILSACGSKSVCAVLLTHGHFDHIGAADAILAAHPNAKLMIHADDLPMLQDPVLNAGAGFGLHAAALSPAEAFADGDWLELAGLSFQVIHTPGHTPGSCCFLLENDLFSGDTLFGGGGYGRTDLPGGSLRQMMASLRRLQPIAEGRSLRPGHGGA